MATSAVTPSFPCIEQPMRVRLRSDRHGFYVATGRRGKVFSSRKPRDEFMLVPATTTTDTSKSAVSIQSTTDGLGRLLAVKDGLLCTIEATKKEDAIIKDLNMNEKVEAENSKREDVVIVEDFKDEGNKEDEDDSAKWCIIKSSNGIMLQSLSSSSNSDASTMLASNNQGSISLSSCLDDCLWHADIVTGELCFLSNPNGRLRCDLLGLLGLTDNWKGWEVWRFIESGDGFVKISSWMHSQYVLGCDKDGNVSTCSYTDESKCTDWAVEKMTGSDHDGVMIRSATHAKLLSTKIIVTNEEKNSTKVILVTVDLQQQKQRGEGEKNDAYEMHLSSTNAVASCWQIEAAHRQTYSLLSIGKSLDQKPLSIGPFPYVTPNHKQMDQWKLEQRNDGTVTLLLQQATKAKEEAPEPKYLSWCDDVDDEVRLSDTIGETELWILEPTVGGYRLRSNKKTNAYLSFTESDDVNSKLCTVATIVAPEEASLDNGDKKNQGQNYPQQASITPVLWQLDPCMPRAVSSSKIKTFAIGTTAAIATTVAMPFAMAGVMGVLGAVGAEVGLLANIVTVGLTGAEAIASVGVVGATAAIVFRQASDTLTIDADESGDSNLKNAYSKRPFCAWRSW